jgi:molybdopterin molybdotransferase
MARDVRMRGFKERAEVRAVMDWVDAQPLARRSEPVSLSDACGRVLAADVVAEVAVPAFRRAAMDGWALRGEETFGAAAGDAIPFRVIGVSLPGAPFDGAVGRGEAVRIMTGAAVPEGADAVLRAEDGSERDDRLEVREPTPPKKHVGRPGEDVAVGDIVLPEGRRLRPQDVGVTASIGCATLPVIESPAVRIITTGNELLPPGSKPDGVHIVDSNTPMLAALVARDGGTPVVKDIVRDGESNVRAALEDPDGDVLLVSGGSSVGQEDHAPRLVDEMGELVFHGVAMRPASPSGVGRIGDRLVFLLPGNPVSTLSAYDFFAGRIVRRLAGRSPEWPYPQVRAPLTRKIASVLGRLDYVRCTFDGETITPLMTTGASILSSTTRADGFVIVPSGSEGYAEGSEVEIALY